MSGEQKITVDDTERTVSFGDALYHAHCADCDEELEWVANFDADGTSYSAECCGYWYSLHPATVTASREKKEEEE